MMITPEQQAAFAVFGQQVLDQPKQSIIAIQQQPIDLSVLAAVAPPVQEAPILFCKPNDLKHGWLHHQFPSTFKGTKGGQKYFSAEHYYCEKKAVVANDEITRQNILAVSCVPVVNNQFDWTAVDAAHAQAHALSRAMTTLNPVEWLNHSVQMMRQAITYKFCQDETLFKLLLDTGNAYLIYASPEDAYWGIGCSEQQALTGQMAPNQWGRNLLGNLLMELRNKLRVEGRPDWGHIMAVVPQPSLTRKRSAADISAEVPVATVVIEPIPTAEVKIDEEPLLPVQEQIAIIENNKIEEAKDEIKIEEVKPVEPVAEVKTDSEVTEPNRLMDLFGK